MTDPVTPSPAQAITAQEYRDEAARCQQFADSERRICDLVGQDVANKWAYFAQLLTHAAGLQEQNDYLRHVARELGASIERLALIAEPAERLANENAELRAQVATLREELANATDGIDWKCVAVAPIRKRAKQLRKVAKEFNIDAAVQDADWLDAYATLLEQQQTRTCLECCHARWNNSGQQRNGTPFCSLLRTLTLKQPFSCASWTAKEEPRP